MDSLRPGDPERIEGYVLYRLLGVGGMGEVFLGRSPGGKAVAVKLISPLFASDPEFRRRFRLEVEAGRKVGGFHAAQVIDANLDAERPWMVTTYVAGPSLKQALAKHRALPAESVRVLGAGLAEALVAIHRAEVIHRDLKPSNILLSYDGPHVIDFGIASAIDASSATTQPGTPGFIAPEIVKGGPASRACDVFALGVVLAVASGISPFGEGRPDEITYRIVHEDPELEGLDPQIRGLIEECLAKDPTEAAHARADPGTAGRLQLGRRLAPSGSSRHDARVCTAAAHRSGAPRATGRFTAARCGAGRSQSTGPVCPSGGTGVRGESGKPVRPCSRSALG